MSNNITRNKKKAALKKIFCLFLCLSLILGGIPLGAGFQEVYAESEAMAWESMGAIGSASSPINAVSTAVDSNGILYVLYKDSTQSNKATVKKYDGTNWETLGAAGFSTGEIFEGSIAVDYSGKPYVAYRDAANSMKATVMTFDGDIWGNVGSAGFSQEDAYGISMALDSSGVPYVAYRDGQYDHKATVQKYDETNGWSNVGNPGFSVGGVAYISIAIASDKTPYVAYGEGGDSFKATVRKYDEATGWSEVGSAFSSGYASFISLALDNSDIPYVAYGSEMDYGTMTSELSVKKYEGTGESGWSDVGSPLSSNGDITYISLKLHNGIPYIAYITDVDFMMGMGKTAVKGYTGADWTDVGFPGDVAGSVHKMSMSITPSGKIYVAYTDADNDYTTSVMEYTVANVSDFIPVTGISGAAATTTVGTDLTLSGTVAPANATNKDIAWSIYDAGTTGATIHGGVLSTTGVGTVTVRATIAEGLTETSDYTQDFVIVVTNATEEPGAGNTQPWQDIEIPALLTGEDIIASAMAPGAGESFYMAIGRFDEGASSTSLSVMQYDGSAWTTVGEEMDISENWIYSMGLAQDEAGNLYLAYITNGDNASDLNSQKLIVKKYDGSNWTTLGTEGEPVVTAGFTSIYNGQRPLSLAVSGGGVPYVAYLDNNGTMYTGPGSVLTYEQAAGDDTIRIISYTSGIWTELTSGESFAASSFSITVDDEGVLYLLYSKEEGLFIKEYDGSAWSSLEGGNLPINEIMFPALHIDSTGIPYLSYADANTGNISVSKYNGSIWTDEECGITGAAGFLPSLAIDSDGAIYLSYSDLADEFKVHVKKNDGTGWTDVGEGSITDTFAFSGMFNTKGGTIYLQYQVPDENNKIVENKMFKYIPPATEFVGVTDITEVPAAAVAGTDLSLTGRVAPANATNKNIQWSVADAGTTGATISGSMLSTTAAGTVTIRATVANGIADGEDYTYDFEIEVSGSGGAVSDAAGLQEALTDAGANGGTVTMAGDITCSATINIPSGKTVILDGGNSTLTGTGGTALQVSGSGKLILKNITLQGGVPTNTGDDTFSCGLYVKNGYMMTIATWGYAHVKGGNAGTLDSYGLRIYNCGTDNISLTTAVGGSGANSYGVYNINTNDTISIGTTAGGTATAISAGLYNQSGSAIINLGTSAAGAGGTKAYGIYNNGAYINVTTANGGGAGATMYDAYNEVVGSTRVGTLINGKSSGGASVITTTKPLTLHKNSETDTCVLPVITIKNTGNTQIGTIPTSAVDENGTPLVWYTSAAKTTLFSIFGGLTSGITDLYAGYPPVYAATVSTKVNGAAADVTDNVELRQGGAVKYTADKTATGTYMASAVSGTYNVFAGGTDTGVTITINNAAGAVTVSYYTVQFAISNPGSAAGSSISATAGGTAIISGAKVPAGKTIIITAAGPDAADYTYSWSGSGAGGATTAALTIPSLNSAVNVTCRVISPDTTAPVLTAGAASRGSDTEGTVKFISDEAGEYYYTIVADGADEPTIDTSGEGISCTTGETIITNPTGLMAGAMDIYIQVKDAAGNISNALKIDVPLAADATLKTGAVIKGETAALGTPNAVLGSETAGAVTLSAAQAEDTSNTSPYITLFDKNHHGAAVKAVKYASGASAASFDTDSDYANQAVSNNDFFIIKVVAEDASTTLYYRVNVRVLKAPGSEVTANNSEELENYMSDPNVSVINLIAGRTYQYNGGTITRNLTINGNGATLIAEEGVNDNVVRSDGSTVSLSDYPDVKTFLRIEGSSGLLKLKNLTLKYGSDEEILNGTKPGIFAVINVKADSSLDMDHVTITGFHNNSTSTALNLRNNQSFGIHAEPGALSTTIKNCTFESSNAFRNAIAIRKGNIEISSNTFEGTDYPERLRQADGYEYAIYLYGGNGTVSQNTISGYDSTTQEGYGSGGISVIGFYAADVVLQDNVLTDNSVGIDITKTWTPWSLNSSMKVNNHILTDSEAAYIIGEALRYANVQNSVSVSLDQNDEIYLGRDSQDKEIFTVLGGYRAPWMAVKSHTGNKVTLHLSQSDMDIFNLADTIGFEVQKDGSSSWETFTAFSFVNATEAELTLEAGHSYRIRLKTAHTSYVEAGDPAARTLITYSNAISNPEVPAAVTAITAGSGKATVSFTAPVNNGGSAITGYKVYVYKDGIKQAALTTIGSSSPITVSGLSNGTAYSFKVVAVNALGESQESAASNGVTPSTPARDDTTSSGGYKPSPASTPAPAAIEQSKETGVNVLVNGKLENAGTATTEKVGDKTVTTVTIDPAKLEQKLVAEGSKAVVTIPVSTMADVVVGQLNGQMVKNMESKTAILEIKTDTASYTLPVEQLNIAAISAQLGQNVALKDITVQVEIAKASNETTKLVESSAAKGSFSIVASPVEFTIRCSSGDKTVEVSSFNAYVERTIAIPDGVDPSKITTGIVVEPDGTVRHVPTRITIIDGKYYAVINSLTNSSYSVVWHPLEFKDAANHWAKAAINDMGSRMVIAGTDSGMFEPNRDITRGEFAAIVVRALGLKPGTGSNPFSDVSASEWYCEYIQTAGAYGIISGYDNGKFGPNDKITREQAIVMIARAMKITDLKAGLTADSIDTLLAGFGDSGQAAAYAKESIAVCVKMGIVSGKSGKRLAPKDKITRAEVAVIVKLLLQKSNLI